MFSKSNLDYTIFSSIIGGLKKYDAYRFISRKELAIPPPQEGGRERERQTKSLLNLTGNKERFFCVTRKRKGG
jgi:hypothetical protein